MALPLECPGDDGSGGSGGAIVLMLKSIASALDLAKRAYKVAQAIKNAEMAELILNLRDRIAALREEALALHEVPILQGEEIIGLKRRNLEMAQKVVDLELDLREARILLENKGDQFLVFGRFHFRRSDGGNRRPSCPKGGQPMLRGAPDAR